MELARQKAVLFGFLFCLLGYAVHFGTVFSLCMTIPAACLLAARSSRPEAFVDAVLYYGFALSPMPAAIHGFWNGSPGEYRLLYPCAVLLLSLPWVLVWGEKAREFRCLGAVLLTAIPPLGLIGWYSPLSAAGWLFPGCGLTWGLIAVLCILSAGVAAVQGRGEGYAIVAFIAAMAVVANIGYRTWPHDPAEQFVGINLHRDQSRREDPAYQQQMRDAIREHSNASVIVLPEAAFLGVTPLTDFFFADTFASLEHANHVLLAGATIVEAGERYRNGFILRGAEVGFYDQHVPVPVAMWRPFTGEGAAIHPIGPYTFTVHEIRTAVLVCYEMLIPWPAIAALAQSPQESPQELVGIANDDWAAGAPEVVKLQRNSLEGWARLAGADSVFAANLPLGANQ